MYEAINAVYARLTSKLPGESLEERTAGLKKGVVTGSVAFAVVYGLGSLLKIDLMRVTLRVELSYRSTRDFP